MRDANDGGNRRHSGCCAQNRVRGRDSWHGIHLCHRSQMGKKVGAGEVVMVGSIMDVKKWHQRTCHHFVVIVGKG